MIPGTVTSPESVSPEAYLRAKLGFPVEFRFGVPIVVWMFWGGGPMTKNRGEGLPDTFHTHTHTRTITPSHTFILNKQVQTCVPHTDPNLEKCTDSCTSLLHRHRHRQTQTDTDTHTQTHTHTHTHCHTVETQISTVDCLWFVSVTSMQKARANLGVPIVMLSPENATRMAHAAAPFHESYQYLTAIDKSNYLRHYLWHHYGGGWFDIKPMYHSWRPSWEQFNDSDVWLIGPPEEKPGDVASWNKTIRSHFRELVACNQFIGRPGTPLSLLMQQKHISMLNSSLPRLKRQWEVNLRMNRTMPGRCCTANQKKDLNFTIYPLEWALLNGKNFHPACFKYRKHIRANMKRYARREPYV